MAIKARINNIERNLMPKGNSPIEEWKAHVKRLDEMSGLYKYIEKGDLKACIRYIQLVDQSEKWKNQEREYIESMAEYRDTFLKVVAMQRDEKPDYEAENFIDVWAHNLKAAHDYMERIKDDPAAKPPKLKVLKESKDPK